MVVCRKRHSSDQSLLLCIAYETVRGRPEQGGNKKNKNNSGNKNGNEEEREEKKKKRKKTLEETHNLTTVNNASIRTLRADFGQTN